MFFPKLNYSLVLFETSKNTPTKRAFNFWCGTIRASFKNGNGAEQIAVKSTDSVRFTLITVKPDNGTITVTLAVKNYRVRYT